MDKVFFPTKMPSAIQGFTEIRVLENFPYKKMEDLMQYCHKLGNDKDEQKQLSDVHIYQHYLKEHYVIVQSFGKVTYILFLEQGKSGFLGTQDYILSEGTLALSHSSRKAIATNQEKTVIRNFFEALDINCSDAVLGIAMTDLKVKKRTIEPTAVFHDLFLEMYKSNESLHAALDHFKISLYMNPINTQDSFLKTHCLDSYTSTTGDEDLNDVPLINKMRQKISETVGGITIVISISLQMLMEALNSSPLVLSTTEKELINAYHEITRLEPIYPSFLKVLSIYSDFLSKFNDEEDKDNKEGYKIEDISEPLQILYEKIVINNMILLQFYQEIYDLLFSNSFFTVYHYEMKFKYNDQKHYFSLSTISLAIKSDLPVDERIQDGFILQRYNGKEWENMLCVIHNQVVFVNESHGLTRMDLKRILGQLCTGLRNDDILRVGHGLDQIEPNGVLLQDYGIDSNIFEIYPEDNKGMGNTIISYHHHGEELIDILEKNKGHRTYLMTLTQSEDNLVLKEYSPFAQEKEQSILDQFHGFKTLIELKNRVKNYSQLLPEIMLT
ncbi:hypothetical protein K5X82_17990 [Halosquirtibacter xylanolyticus]|uniref:hypothetical protein n=1 Tax=Halosquirtibacter xylanolyticus TaxID=3374599 RepID=UPI0037488035|nr:hypothetical protein K5X82_17990 [Prolixibacteraceae bacterium]